MKRKRIPVPAKQQIDFYKKNYGQSIPLFDQPSTSQVGIAAIESPLTSITPESPMQILSSGSVENLGAPTPTIPLDNILKKKQKTKHLENTNYQGKRVEAPELYKLKSATYLGISNDELFEELGNLGNVFKLLDTFDKEECGIKINDLGQDIIKLSEQEVDKILENDETVKELYELVMAEQDIFDDNGKNDSSNVNTSNPIDQEKSQDGNAKEDLEKYEIEYQTLMPTADFLPQVIPIASEDKISSPKRTLGSVHRTEEIDSEEEEEYLEMQRDIIRCKYVEQRRMMELLKKLEEDFDNLSEFRRSVKDVELGLMLEDQCRRLKKEIENKQGKILALQEAAEKRRIQYSGKKAAYEKALQDPSNPKNIMIIKNYENEKRRKHEGERRRLISREEWLREKAMLRKKRELTENQKEIKRAKARERYANMTEIQKEMRKDKDKQRRMNMTEEQRERKRIRDRFESMTEEQRERKRAKARERRMNMTEEQREIKRLKAREKAANMTEEEREIKRAKSRVENMTAEQIERKKARDKERRMNMTEEQRERKKAQHKEYRERKKAEKLAQLQ